MLCETLILYLYVSQIVVILGSSCGISSESGLNKAAFLTFMTINVVLIVLQIQSSLSKPAKS